MGLGSPDSFLDSLRAVIVVSREFSFVIGGYSLADSLDTFRLRVGNSEDPIPGPSQGRDSMLGFLRHLVGIASASLPLAVGPSSLHLGDGVKS